MPSHPYRNMVLWLLLAIAAIALMGCSNPPPSDPEPTEAQWQKLYSVQP